MHTGDPDSLDAVLQSQYVLDDSQYFSSSEVVSEAPNPITHTIPITVKQKKTNTTVMPSVQAMAQTQRARQLTWTDRPSIAPDIVPW